MDVLSKEQRHYNMSRIKDKNTKPELVVRKFLFSKGLRYRLHRKDLPGKPDIVLPKYRVVVFVNGCFWHMHNCKKFVLPSTNTGFWHKKLSMNKERDKKNYKILKKSGWKIIICWECKLSKNSKQYIEGIYEKIISSIE